MNVFRYRKRASVCSNYVSSYIAVNSEPRNAVVRTELNMSCDADGLREDEQCTWRTYCDELLQLPVIGEYRDNRFVEQMNKDLNRNVE